MRPQKAFCSFNTDYRASHLVYLEHFGNGFLNFSIICMWVSSCSPPSLWGSRLGKEICARSRLWSPLLSEKLVGKLVSRERGLGQEWRVMGQGVLYRVQSPSTAETRGGDACL